MDIVMNRAAIAVKNYIFKLLFSFTYTSIFRSLQTMICIRQYIARWDFWGKKIRYIKLAGPAMLRLWGTYINNLCCITYTFFMWSISRVIYILWYQYRRKVMMFFLLMFGREDPLPLQPFQGLLPFAFADIVGAITPCPCKVVFVAI